MKLILCLDFDGVCHNNIPVLGREKLNRHVAGLFEALREYSKHFRIHIYSVRSHQPGGIALMKRWFAQEMDVWARETKNEPFLLELEFPQNKPPGAHIFIDDRGFQFVGVWPSVDLLLRFIPWNERDR